MTKRMKFPISTARSRIFQLADLVRAGGDTVVVLEQRGGAEPVALVREARLAYLEERVRQLDQRGAPCTLSGSLASAVDDETLERSLREIRGAWAPGPERQTAQEATGRRKTRKGAGR